MDVHTSDHIQMLDQECLAPDNFIEETMHESSDNMNSIKNTAINSNRDENIVKSNQQEKVTNTNKSTTTKLIQFQNQSKKINKQK